VCLGHQCIGALHGMEVRRHTPVHGKTSSIRHDGRGLFAGVPDPFTAMRYHSLVVSAKSIPPLEAGRDGWEISAWIDEHDPHEESGQTGRIVMGLRRVWASASKAPLEGVQFHPESFLTQAGAQILRNFLQLQAAPGFRNAPEPVG
jgi:anthranilate/para-aminobenzoate synthase component II